MGPWCPSNISDDALKGWNMVRREAKCMMGWCCKNMATFIKTIMDDV
jgi:hypothetical protein